MNSITYEFCTHEDFMQIEKQESRFRMEYDNGYIYYMQPESQVHSKVKDKLLSYISENIEYKSCKLIQESAALILENNKGIYEFKPDIVIVDNLIEDDNGKYKGVPNLVVEILPYSSRYRDTGLKLDVYENVGVREYWIVDINKEETNVYSNNNGGRYLSQNIYSRIGYKD